MKTLIIILGLCFFAVANAQNDGVYFYKELPDCFWTPGENDKLDKDLVNQFDMSADTCGFANTMFGTSPYKWDASMMPNGWDLSLNIVELVEENRLFSSSDILINFGRFGDRSPFNHSLKKYETSYVTLDSIKDEYLELKTALTKIKDKIGNFTILLNRRGFDQENQEIHINFEHHASIHYIFKILAKFNYIFPFEGYFTPIHTGINDLSKTDKIKIYSNHIELKSKYSINIVAHIYDMQGKKILSGQIENSRINISTLVKGTYILVINNESYKFIR